MRAANMKRVLRSVVFFESLSDDLLQSLMDIAVCRDVAKGDVLFSEGQVENHLFLIEQGRVEISRDGPHFGRQTFALLGPGEHFGALSLFYTEAHFATATAVEPVRVRILKHEDFQALLRRQPALAWAILKGMAMGIRAANGEIRRWTTLADRRSRPQIELPRTSRGIPPQGPTSPAG